MGNTVKSISVIDSINGNVDFAEAEKLINFSNVSTVIIHIHNTPEKIEEQAYAASEKSEKSTCAFKNDSVSTHSTLAANLVLDALALSNPLMLGLPCFVLKKLLEK